MSLRTRLLLAIGYVLLVAIVAFEVPLAINTSNRVESEVRAQASAQADLLAIAAAEELGEGAATLRPLVDTAAETVRGRVIVVDSEGRLLADSAGEQRGRDFSSRPEVADALAGRTVQRERQSTDLELELLATAAPVRLDGDTAGAVRITQSTEAESEAALDAIGALVLIGLVVLAIGMIAGVIVARQLSEPLRDLTRTAERIAGGDLEQRVSPSGSSEQVALSRAFNEMTARLSDALTAQRRFVADASHQLRTPIAGLRLRLEEARALLVSPDSAGASAATAEIDAATGEIDRLSHVVSEMLTLSRIGERHAPSRRISTARLVADAAERWRSAAEEKEIELRVLAGTSGAVECPPEDADRALDALIENAIRYSPPRTTISLVPKTASIEIVDQGPGIPDQELGPIFERFHRGTSGRRGPKGTGLGLAIARELARSWQGDVRLGPGDRGGTRATLSFAEPASDDVDGRA